MTFKEIGINEPILTTLKYAGYTNPTEIQEQAIPFILKGKDVLGCAQTGTGKTAAFALPIIQRIVEGEPINYDHRRIRVLVVSPTRELAIQIKENFQKYSVKTGIKTAVIVGGVNQTRQVSELKKGIDVLVATPGRLIDLVNQGFVNLSKVEMLVLDEADTMLDMGFVKDINKIVALVPKTRQTLLFSATMPATINKLAESYLNNHETIKVTPESTTVELINQSLYYVDKNNKIKLLTSLLKREENKSTLVFTRTKHGANKLSKFLDSRGIAAEVIHGNRSQNARVRALKNFKDGTVKVMIATDIAARGIDISELSHVINYEMPNQPETYAHRIGRTGRAGLGGTAISFADINEKPFIKDIQNTIKQNIPIVEDHEFPMINLTPSPKETKVPRKMKKQGSKNSSSKSPNRNYKQGNRNSSPMSGRSNYGKPGAQKNPSRRRSY